MVDMSDMHYARAYKEVRALALLCIGGNSMVTSPRSTVSAACFVFMLFQVTEYLSSVGAVYSNDAALGSDRDSEVRVSSISDSASVALFMKYVFEAPQSVCAPAVTV
jgi:ATP-dependent phosphoenolpyruvate carboxykinase